ncbi:AAA family ATPase [Haliangium sp.]|uniref:AAA family ATPase n=1 Tax=Haliangium sp. TaxID=2663208 RepID=UPI003D0D34F7
MRPLRLRMSGLRSYTHEHRVDFSQAGLMAVVGDTGAGKSSILEAICFALYGSPTWSGRAVKDLIAHGADTMEVELEFQARGDTWTVYRSTSKNNYPPARCRLTCPARDLNLDGRKPVDAEIEALIGLRYEAFLRCVILPQGRFQELLRATPAERAKLLEGVFGLDLLGRVRDWADTVLRERQPQLATLRERRAGLLPDPAAEAERARAERDARQAEEKVLTELSRRYREADRAGRRTADDAAALAARVQPVADAGQADEDQPAALAARIQDLAARAEEMAAAAAALAQRRGQIARDLAALDEAERIRAEAGHDQAGLDRAEHALDRLVAIIGHMDENERAGAAARDALTSARRAHTRAKNKRDQAQDVLDQARRADMAAHLRTALRPGEPCPVCGQDAPELGAHAPGADLAAAERDLARADKTLGSKEKALRKAEKALDQALDRVRAGHLEASAVIATLPAGLRPEPTAPAESTLDSEAQLVLDPASEPAVDPASEAVAAAHAEPSGPDAPTRLPGVAAVEAVRERLAGHRAELDAARARRRDFDRDRADLEQEARALARRRTDEVELVAERLRSRLEARAEAAQALADALGQPPLILPARAPAPAHEPAGADVAAALTAGLTALAEALSAGLGTLLERARARVAELRGQAAEHDARARALLAEHDLADADALQQALGRRQAEIDHAEQRRATAEGQIEPARALDHRIETGAAHLAAVTELKALLAPNKLMRYAVQRKQEALLTVASRLLGDMSTGRFGFGPDFTVVDRRAGEARAPETLSGGETFLASLALALALVELAGRSGGRLDALFLDEGFGSLDADTLDLAVEALVAQTQSGRLVAVISHIRAVAESIDDVLYVEAGPSGSSTRWLDPEERNRLALDDAGLLL